jgi:HSP20 family protein
MPENSTATKTAMEARAAVPIKITGGIFETLDHLYQAISRRAFEIFEGNGRTGTDLENWFKAESELLHPVKLNVSENEKSLTLEAEVPGFTEKDLQIEVEPQRVTITGKRETSKKQEKGKTVYEEMHSDEILRVVDLPAQVEAGKASATLKNGVLEVEMPKIVKSVGTRVEVKAA